MGQLVSGSVLCCIVHLTTLILVTQKGEVYAAKAKACNRTRVVLEGSWGKFGDGPGDYPQASHCQWLVRAANPNQFISLKFLSLATECSYDHIYVYDGATFDSPKLAVLSGKNSPETVTATSGSMLVLLYSDTNYALEGFEAEYSVTDCLLNCSSHGVCSGSDHSCLCEAGFSGDGCQYPQCPDDCNSNKGQGHCFSPPVTAEPSSAVASQRFCVCEPGYYGDRCSLGYGAPSAENIVGDFDRQPDSGGGGSVDDPETSGSDTTRDQQEPFIDEYGDVWHWLWRGGQVPGMAFTPRTSHGTIYIPELDRVYIFGGYDLNNVLGDLVMFDVENATWLSVGDEKSTESFHRRMHSQRLARFWRYRPSFSPASPPLNKMEQASSSLFPPEQYPPMFPVKPSKYSLQASTSGAKQGKTRDEFITRLRPEALSVSSIAMHQSANTSVPPQNFTFSVNTKNTVSVKLKQSDMLPPVEEEEQEVDVFNGLSPKKFPGYEDKLISPNSGVMDESSSFSNWMPDRFQKLIDDFYKNMNLSVESANDQNIQRTARSSFPRPSTFVNRQDDDSFRSTHPDGLPSKTRFGKFNPSSSRRKHGSSASLANKKERMAPASGSAGIGGDDWTVMMNARSGRMEDHPSPKRRRWGSRKRRMVPPGSDLNRGTGSESRQDTRLLPRARFGHVMARYRQHFMLYGGKLRSGDVVAEFWLYNTTSETWTLLSPSSYSGNPPGLLYATLTLVGSDWLYLFGGSLPHGAFSSDMYRINMGARQPRWEKVECRGGNPLDARLVGHSTVYHAASHALLVYGGIRVDIARFSKLSDRLLVFDLHHGYWSELQYPRDTTRAAGRAGHVPLERAFHSALVAGDYMVVFGGYLHKHKEEETCYDHQIYLYHLKCHTWQTRSLVTPLTDAEKGLRNAFGVYGHGAFLLHNRTLVVAGGFHGTVSNSLLAYTLPTPLLPGAATRCHHYTSQAVCISGHSGVDGSGCVWCNSDKRCYPRSETVSCTTNLQTASCPGICPLLTTCNACTLSSCTWCPYTRTCHGFDASSCRDGGGDIRPAVVGSLGGVTNVENCGKTAGSGLTYTLYRPPVDFSRPDDVKVSNGSFLEMQTKEEFRGERKVQASQAGVDVGRLDGFILPSAANLGLKLRAEHLNATLTIDGDVKQTIYSNGEATSGKDFTFSEAPGPAYVIRIEGRSIGSLSLVWIGGNGGEQPVSGSQLRVFRSGFNCTNHTNCLSCVTDSACGWCPVNGGSCISNILPCSGLKSTNGARDAGLGLTPQNPETIDDSLGGPVGGGLADSNGQQEELYYNYYHILVPSECPLCQQHIYCSDCAGDSDCEWLPDHAHCTRRGRFTHLQAVTSPALCPPECHTRWSCTQCLGTPGRCAWCQDTKECFLFSLYTSVYQYGACRAWLDEDHTNVTAMHQPVSVSPTDTSFGKAHIYRETVVGGATVMVQATRSSGSVDVIAPDLLPNGFNQNELGTVSVKEASSTDDPLQLVLDMPTTTLSGVVPSASSRDDFDVSVVATTLPYLVTGQDESLSTLVPGSHVKALNLMQRPVGVSDCTLCSSLRSCDECLQSLECGWCYNTLNPTIGVCVAGDYHNPKTGSCDNFVNELIDFYTSKNISLTLNTTSASLPSASDSTTIVPATLSPSSDVDRRIPPSAPFLPVFDSNNRSAGYAYTSCPDLDECYLKLHECHELATCANMIGTYNCTCKRGYMGDGRRSCERTCNMSCVHGTCSNAPKYVCLCDLGWTGVDCGTDCGCHNHSTCTEGVGTCDACQGNTHGERCHLCKDNTWGNATTPASCQECSCNEHGDASRGTCHRDTGQCFCTHNTRGRNCELCEQGFYGNPAKGGKCYRQCEPRNVIYRATSGNLGAQKKEPTFHHQHMRKMASLSLAFTSAISDRNSEKTSYGGGKHGIYPGSFQLIEGNDTETCLWIITPYKTVEPPPAASLGTNIIIFTLDDINVPCHTSALLVYDGVPEVVSIDSAWDRRNHVLGSYCSEYTSSVLPTVVEAKSGYLTVLMQRRDGREVFSASYEVLSCPDRPGANRVCVGKKPVCAPGGVGANCSTVVCPSNCNAASGRGACDQEYGRCVCNDKYVGHDCGSPRRPHLVLLQELFEVHKFRSASQNHLLTVLPRFGHSMLADHRGVLWLFGGYSLSRGPLNDVVQFDTRNNTWVPVTVTVQPGVPPPPHRYFHSSCYVPSKRAMFVYGGLSSSSYLSDLWSFSVDSEGWTLLDRPLSSTNIRSEDEGNGKEHEGINERVYFGGSEVSSEEQVEFLMPPPLGGHTLTYCNDGEKEVLLLIGGVSDVEGFLDIVWEYRVSSGSWSVLNTTGTIPLGLYGHSTVYHSEDRVFYVYGGYSYKVDKVGLHSDLYAFHYPTKVWSLLPTDTMINQYSASRPAPRAFHTAVTTSEYLLVIGGHIKEEDRDLQQALMVYSYKCNMWIPLNKRFITQLGPELYPSLGLSSAIHQGTIYIYGGYDGVAHGGMMSINIPEDLCTLNANNETQCRDRIGCANCVVFNSTGHNTSHCYSNAGNASRPNECFGTSGSDRPGKACDASQLQKDCYQYDTCATCLAKYPAVPGSKQKCKWCHHCNKPKCIPRENDCVSEITCEGGGSNAEVNDTRVIFDTDHCPEKSCAASDCSKCENLMQCIWTRQVVRSHSAFTLNFTPIYNWNCVDSRILNHSSFLVESSPPQTCPSRCFYHNTCSSCLSSYGAEGGWQNCYWSETLRTCMAPSYVPLRCLSGRCGLLLQEKPCPRPCATHKTCSSCLQHPECGWCGLATAVGGLGVCSEGSLEGPHLKTCSQLDYSHLVSNASVVALHELSPLGPPPEVSWHYLKCPAEDECRSGHHTCHPRTQVCVDEEEGYSCRCATGYDTGNDSSCIPRCSQGCVSGTCVEPDNCTCNFGFVGTNCSITCQCNGHSDCKGPDKLSECNKCYNNTRGPQCSKCLPYFVGDPANGVTCVSCTDYCNQHSTKCYPRDAKSKLSSMQLTEKEEEEMEAFTEAICPLCQNNTTGHSCQSCLPGFFRGSTDLHRPCKPCECNGHSSTCNEVWGDSCNCSNNTVSPCAAKTSRGISGKDEDKDCQKKQCTKCKDSYLGNPSDGHQCYYQMGVEKEYCLNTDSQSHCDSNPGSLSVGQTVYFGVQPKFMNVNIRLVLDITEGAVKVYFSSEEDTFLVNMDKSTLRHKVEIDPKYPLKQDRHPFHGTRALNRNYIGNGLGMHDILNVAPALSKEVLPTVPVAVDSDSSTRNHTKALLSQFKLIEKNAFGLKTFITVDDPTDILMVHNVTNRLVITLPQNGHDLRSAKFYLIIEGTGDRQEASIGSVFFRQDQPRIDLFVFFSVFFSCFFLFLAVCVVVWKIKQGVDMRRARRRHVVEMLHMAKRPFAVTTLIIQDSDPQPYAPLDLCAGIASARGGNQGSDLCLGLPHEPPPWSPGRRKRPTPNNKKDQQALLQQQRATGGGTGANAGTGGSCDGVQVGPVAVEPTDDGVAAVVTVVVQFPGFGESDDPTGPDVLGPTHRLALGSALSLMSRIYPPSKPFQIRRRMSHGAP